MTDISRPDSSGARSSIAHRGVDVVLVTVRELRLVLGLLLVLFVTSETWRWIGRLTAPRLALFMLVTLVAALLVVAVGLRRTVARPAVHRATVRVAGEVVGLGAILFGAFAAVGVLSVDAGVVADWSGSGNGILLSLGVGDPPLVLTRQLLQVSAFLAALGALAFAIEVIVDEGTRHSLLRDIVEPTEPTEPTEPAEPSEPTEQTPNATGR
jgi:succinate dehydrogenase hydrophobic anchor subunit